MLSLIDVSGGRLAFIFGGGSSGLILVFWFVRCRVCFGYSFSEARGGRPPPLTSVRE